MRHQCVSRAEEEFSADLGKRVMFRENHLHAVGQRTNRALGPFDGAFGSERGHGGACVIARSCTGDCCAHYFLPPAEPLSEGLRSTIERFSLVRHFCARACTCAGVTSRKSVKMVLIRCGELSNNAKQASACINPNRGTGPPSSIEK